MATITPYKRELPFIHRAWKTAVDHFTPYSMGIKLSSANGDNVVNGDHAPRAAKRRRITDDSPESAPRGAVGHLLSENPSDFEKALRVEILQITHIHSPSFRSHDFLNGTRSPSKKDISTFRIRCKLIICQYRDASDYRVLYCDSQICHLKVFRDPDDVCRRARVYLNAPFHVPAEKIYVTRDDDDGFNLADRYVINAELESAGDPNWPPVDLLPKEEARENIFSSSSSQQHFALTAQIVYNFEHHRTSAPVKIRKRAGDNTSLDLAMDMDIRWSACHTAGSTTRSEDEVTPPGIKVPYTNGALEPLTNGHVNGRVENHMNGHATDVQDVLMDEDEEHEEATTPSRSLRTRGKQQNYNLKLLSDKARGKERKERKRRKLADIGGEAGQVTWVLPHTGEVTLKDYQCIRCFAVHPSMSLLERHMKDHHPEFRSDFDLNSSRIWITVHGQETLRRSKSTLSEISGSEGHGSDFGEPESPQTTQRTLARSKFAQVPLPAKPKDTRQLVPSNKQPIFDRLSKALLEPGTLVDPPEIDDTWLSQKHREIIRDYSDVHQDEKEFISEWDAFVNRNCVTSEPHLQDVYLRFVESKASWLVASQSRTTEFAKHLAYLKARNSLAEATISEALNIMRHAASQRRPGQPEAIKTPSPRTEYRKSASGCAVCGQPVRGPATIICSNMDCDRPLYHTNCACQNAITPVDSVESCNWRCNSCVQAKEAA
ncbi:hypothetical protein F5B20DRAFT_555754 [Whalleya microplaca]|nr:hypothetical protein F5B20DRAFT_555754 [Whalleya microplaca]